jgi:hypothetical protein
MSKVDKRKLYMDKIKAQLDQNGAKIQVMRAKVAEANADMKLGYLKQVDGLEGSLKGLKKKFGQLNNSNDTTWKKLRRGLHKTGKR